MDASDRDRVGQCPSVYYVTNGLGLRCVQHLGSPSRVKHSARYMGVRWYWTDEEAKRSERPER